MDKRSTSKGHNKCPRNIGRKSHAQSRVCGLRLEEKQKRKMTFFFFEEKEKEKEKEIVEKYNKKN
jgi:hypothetical protein